MDPSHYLKIYPLEEKPGHLLLYSTKKVSTALVTEETFDAMMNRTLSAENKEILSGLGMLVPDRSEEKKDVLSMLDRFNRKNAWLNISVILNLDCNFDCVYCYEGGIKGSLYMNDETAGLLVDFIKERFDGGKKSVNIDFYGGEPLLSRELIRSLSSEIRSFVEGRGGKYTFTLITNGSLFRRKVAEELVPLGLTGVKITIDGPPELHNKSRPFKSGGGSFDTIIRNVRETADLLKVMISGTFQKGNYREFPKLITYLKSEGLAPDRIYQLRFGAVMERPKGELSLPDYVDGYMSVNEPWVIEAGTFLREKVLESGYRLPRITPSPCQTEIDDAFVINYDGGIYKCPAMIGNRKFEAGTLRDGLENYGGTYGVGNWKNGKCQECVYLPICFGGCRYMTYVREGDIDSVDCKKSYFDAVLERIVKQDIKYA